MRRTTARAGWTTLAAAVAVLLALGTTAAQAAPPQRAARAAAPTTADPQPVSSSLDGRSPSSAQQTTADSSGDRVVAVRFTRGTKASAVAAALPLAAATKTFRASTRSVAPRANAATYRVPAATADAFLAAMKGRPDVADAAYEVFASYDTVPNDPLFLTTSTADRDQASYLGKVSIGSAWNYRGTAAVKVAVVDSGIDVGHPDLSAKVAVGDRWNTVSNTANVTDTVGHGTFVAGIAGASTNNGIGIAGVGWTAKLMAVKVADAKGGLALTDIAEGIRWAADHGAKVINLSLGAPTGSTALADAVAYAQAQDALVVASAGNSAQQGNPKMYPAAYPGVVAVGATDALGHRAWFSEHGSWVTVAAPGIRIRSTTVRAGSDFWPAGSYNFGDGTSFAAPIIAGAAALVWERAPGATAADVRSAVVASGTGYANLGLGTGQVDVAKAMQSIVPSVAPTITSPAPGTTITGPVGLLATRNMSATQVRWFLDGDPIPGSSTTAPLVWDPRGWPQGAHTLEARNCTARACRSFGGDTIPVTIDVPAPTITSPLDGDTVGGNVAVLTTGDFFGAGMAIFDGATRLGISRVGTDAPEVNFTGRDGAHALQAVWCDATGTHCDGSRSAVVNVTAASADISGGTVSEAAFTPNGDGVRDTTSITYTTGSPQTVTVTVTRAADHHVVRTFPAQSVGAGTHTTVWDGLDDLGQFAGTGGFTIRVLSTDGAGHPGMAQGVTKVDLTAPGVTVFSTVEHTFYPVVDGIKDTFRPPYESGETTTVDFVAKNAAGTTVRTLHETLPAAHRGTLAWDGTNDAGTLLPAGTYSWTLTATDSAGNSTTSTARLLDLRHEKLTTRTATVTKAGTGAYAVNAGPACAQVTTSGSSYANGLWLKNTCAKGSSGAPAAFFHLTVPSALRYTGWTVRTTGRSHSAPVDVVAGIFSTETDDYDMTYPWVRVPAGATTTRTLTLGRITTGGHGRIADVVVFLPSTRLAPLTDWDLKQVSVTVSYQVLA